MIKIITALENEYINNKLKKINNIHIVTKDIQYKEGILESLEEDKNIDYILLNKNIEGDITLEKLIENIKLINNNIKIILFIDKKEDKSQYKNNANYYKILYESEIRIENIDDILNNYRIEDKKRDNIYIDSNEETIKKNNNDIRKKIKKLKEIIINNQREKRRIKKYEIINKINNIKKLEFLNLKKVKKKIYILNKKNKFSNKINNNTKKKCFVLYTIGTNGIGKSSVIINLAKALSYLNKKILIIDLDFLNNSIHTILGVKIPQKENYIFKINKNIDLLLSDVLNIKEKNIIYKINLLIIKSRKYYDYILIDTNSYNNIFINKIEEYKEIINNSDYILFISGCNLLEINKSVILLDKYINKFKINKFKLLFNKYNKFAIDPNLLRNIFKEIEILGFIENNERYNFLINKNVRNFNKYRKIRNEYLKIINKIEKIKRSDIYGDR